MTGFRVMQEQCDQCLFSPDRIVDSKRMADVLSHCRRNDTHFICHKASLEGNQDVCCRGFFDTQDSQMIRIADRLGVIQFVTEQEIKDAPESLRREIEDEVDDYCYECGEDIDDCSCYLAHADDDEEYD